MSDLDNFEVEQQIRRQAGDSHRDTAYDEVISRYLAAFSYLDPHAAAAAPAPAGTPVPTGRVIVGVDDIPTSHVAADLAAVEAQLRGCALSILHAGPAVRDTRLMKRLADRVHTFAPVVPVRTWITTGMDPAALLLSEAGPGDLIVVGHRHGAIRGVLRRSVADRVVARHPGPVLVVRITGWPGGLERASRPLIVGADGSATATRAAEFAVGEARFRGCDVVALHVAVEAGDTPDRTDRRGGVTVQERTVTGNPVNELVDASSRAAALVLGRDAGHPRLGAVSRAVMHAAYCPVFLVG